jgi:hypothetical protein
MCASSASSPSSPFTPEASATTFGESGDTSGFTAWAIALGLDPNNPNADADGDGVSNLNEYLQGRNPHVPDSPILGLEIFSPN